jgi:hypothetical protein
MSSQMFPAVPPVQSPAIQVPDVPLPTTQPSAQPVTQAGARWARDPYDGRVTKHATGLADQIEGQRNYLATFGWTAAWYTVPVAIFSAWSLTFPSDAGTACARPTDNACPSPRSAALATLIHGIPEVGIALGIALMVAGLIRLGSTAWRPVTVGFSAAIIGAGLTTVLSSVLSSTG